MFLEKYYGENYKYFKKNEDILENHLRFVRNILDAKRLYNFLIPNL